MGYRLVMESPKGPRGLTRVYTQARTAALRAVGGLWFEEILPLHFTSSAPSMYRYKKRTEGHQRKKRRLYGHNLPNVFSGNMRRRMLGKQPRVVVKKGQATMSWRGLPRYAYVVDSMQIAEYGKSKGKVILVQRPNKAAELTAINKADATILGKKYKHAFLEYLKLHRK